MSGPTQGFILSNFPPSKRDREKWLFKINFKDNDKATASWQDCAKDFVGAQLGWQEEAREQKCEQSKNPPNKTS